MLWWPWLWLGGPSPAHGADLHVGADRSYATPADAIAAASDGDRILLHPGAYGSAVIDRDVELLGVDGPDATTLTAGAGAAIEVAPGVIATVRGLRLDGGGGGRALRVDRGEVVVVDALLTDGAAALGGCVELIGATAAFLRTTIGPCVADEGGGIYATGGAIALEASTIHEAQATAGRGGAIYHLDAALTVVASTLRDNSAYDPIVPQPAGKGGAVYVNGGDIDVRDSTFLRNHATTATADHGSGGAIRLWDGTLTVSGGRFEANVADELGSAVAAQHSAAVVEVTGSRFVGNVVDDYGPASLGGAVSCEDSACGIDASWFEGNAGGDGGAISATGDAIVTRSMFCGNTAGEDAGAIDLGNQPTGHVASASNNVFAGNAAPGNGGAIVLPNRGGAEVVNNHFVDHDAASGGAVALEVGGVLDASHVWRNNLVVDNIAADAALVWHGQPVIEDHNWLYANANADTDGALGTGSVAGSDPALLGPWGSCSLADLEVGAASGTRDAGDPALLDPDGSRSDIGAFGGPGADPGAFADDDGDGVAAMADCDDADAARSPDGIEACNGIDDDCDGLVDAEDQAVDGAWRYADGDGDGHGDPLGGAFACPGAGWAAVGDDCDDGDGGVSPSAGETCNGADDDCDGLVDDEDPDLDVASATLHYADGDGDGYGDPESGIASCVVPDDRVVDGGDCDDGRDDVHPGARDLAGDGVDQDCDGEDGGATGADADADADADVDVDADADADGDVGTDGGSEDDLVDRDGDGYVAAEDCDDTDPGVHPGAAEDPSRVDRNCDGLSDPTARFVGPCGCAVPSSGGGALFAVIAAFAVLRRRRPHSRDADVGSKVSTAAQSRPKGVGAVGMALIGSHRIPGPQRAILAGTACCGGMWIASQTSVAWAGSDCAPLDEEAFADAVAAVHRLIDDEALGTFELVQDAFEVRLPCLTFVPAPEAWARYLVDVAVVSHHNGGDWQRPLATALAVAPGTPLGVGPRHPMAAWTPPEPSDPPGRAPEGVALFVDGVETARLPARGIHLVQVRTATGLRSVLLRDEPLPDHWLGDEPSAEAGPESVAVVAPANDADPSTDPPPPFTLAVGGHVAAGRFVQDVDAEGDHVDDLAARALRGGGHLAMWVGRPLAVTAEIAAPLYPIGDPAGLGGYAAAGARVGPVFFGAGGTVGAAPHATHTGEASSLFVAPAVSVHAWTAAPVRADFGVIAAALPGWERSTVVRAGTTMGRAASRVRAGLAGQWRERQLRQGALRRLRTTEWTVSAQLSLAWGDWR